MFTIKLSLVTVCQVMYDKLFLWSLDMLLLCTYIVSLFLIAIFVTNLIFVHFSKYPGFGVVVTLLHFISHIYQLAGSEHRVES